MSLFAYISYAASFPFSVLFENIQKPSITVYSTIDL